MSLGRDGGTAGSARQTIRDYIDDHDDGSGVPVGDVVQHVSKTEANPHVACTAVADMLADGEVYESSRATIRMV